MTHFEWLISIITFIYALFSVLTFFAIRRQAEIAQSGADAEIAAQSPWIAVNIEHIPGYGGRFTGTTREGSGPEVTHTDFMFHIVCVNHGRTPAWITEKRATFKIIPKDTLPEKPELKSTTVFEDEPEPLAAGEQSSRSQKAYYFQAVGYQGLDEWAVLYGVVNYRDVFGRDRQTTFGYRVTIGDQLVRLAGYHEYNKNT
jgi:hypothetical protein